MYMIFYLVINIKCFKTLIAFRVAVAIVGFNISTVKTVQMENKRHGYHFVQKICALYQTWLIKYHVKLPVALFSSVLCFRGVY